MGKFDGILLCTDFDYTLAVKAKVSPENAEAIRYFQENGGRFTIISGRNPRFLKERIEGFAVNAPLVGYNGALILDENAETVLFSGGRNDLDALDFVERFWETHPAILRVVPHDETPYIGSLSRVECDGRVDTVEELRAKCSLPLYNVICHVESEAAAEALRDEMIAAAGDKFVIVRSWGRGVEVVNPWDQKGVAALRLKKMLGARLLVCAGDFENDTSMVAAADIGYAVENAIPSVKAVADRVTVSCEEHAIAAIIRELEQDL